MIRCVRRAVFTSTNPASGSPIELRFEQEETNMHPRLYRLVEAHQRIDRSLRQELRNRWQDPVRIIQLKKLKLRVKDLIHRFIRRASKA
jgi:uncharacterized protein YdcH (DUF465 family)